MRLTLSRQRTTLCTPPSSRKRHSLGRTPPCSAPVTHPPHFGSSGSGGPSGASDVSSRPYREAAFKNNASRLLKDTPASGMTDLALTPLPRSGLESEPQLEGAAGLFHSGVGGRLGRAAHWTPA